MMKKFLMINLFVLSSLAYSSDMLVSPFDRVDLDTLNLEKKRES